MENEGKEAGSRNWRSDPADNWWEKEEGRVVEEKGGGGTEGGERRKEPLFSDWVVCWEDEEERKSGVSVSKGSGFSCASFRNPFSPFI